MSTKTLLVLRSQKVVAQSQERSRARKDLTLSSVAIVILFIICQSCSSVQKILMWVYNPWVKNARCLGRLEYFVQVPQVAMAFNSAANFIIYVIFAKGFRKKVCQVFTGRNRIGPEATAERLGDTAGPSTLDKSVMS
jgi:hypothetical protein